MYLITASNLAFMSPSGVRIFLGIGALEIYFLAAKADKSFKLEIYVDKWGKNISGYWGIGNLLPSGQNTTVNRVWSSSFSPTFP